MYKSFKQKVLQVFSLHILKIAKDLGDPPPSRLAPVGVPVGSHLAVVYLQLHFRKALTSVSIVIPSNSYPPNHGLLQPAIGHRKDGQFRL